jgi:hypothetical protein
MSSTRRLTGYAAVVYVTILAISTNLQKKTDETACFDLAIG